MHARQRPRGGAESKRKGARVRVRACVLFMYCVALFLHFYFSFFDHPIAVRATKVFPVPGQVLRPYFLFYTIRRGCAIMRWVPDSLRFQSQPADTVGSCSPLPLCKHADKVRSVCVQQSVWCLSTQPSQQPQFSAILPKGEATCLEGEERRNIRTSGCS